MEQFSVTAGGNTIYQKTFTAGSLFIRQGSHIQHAYVIMDGISKCYISEDNGKDYIFEFLGKGEIVGDLEGLRGTPCLCNVEAVTDLSVYVIRQDVFTAMVNTEPAFNRLLMESLAIRLGQTCERASYQQLYPIEYGLLRLLMLAADQQISFSKKDLADYLGITVRSFNRTIRQLREKNVISLAGLRIDIGKRELEALLKAYAE
ncbi:Crp/Fnr family transcriptional regulator [Chitinophaga vietnamensis]|uniref:Crp/Fnr family transcriptional regulator n=1 Tax=Chitinophaga vietnamensis TaxID=2593957 RepID=UPI00191BEDDE|nr:Crp/Fnr family transcriptional regulator [Chitinophaga vietnamensis]